MNFTSTVTCLSFILFLFLSTSSPAPLVSKREVGTLLSYSDELLAGFHVLDTIAGERLTNSLRFSNNVTNVLNLNASDSGNSSLLALQTLCDLNEVFFMFTELSRSSPRNAELSYYKTWAHLMIVPACEWTKFAFHTEYPTNNISLTCTCQNVQSMCNDFKTASFSRDTKNLLLSLHEPTRDKPDIGAWIDGIITGDDDKITRGGISAVVIQRIESVRNSPIQ